MRCAAWWPPGSAWRSCRAPGAAPHAHALGLQLVELEGVWTQRRLLLAMRDREALSGPARAFVEMVERRVSD